MKMKKYLYSLVAMVLMAFASCSSDDSPCMVDGHEYVDLGFPSGRLWATCNVGSDQPEKFGYLFAWGEVELKVVFEWYTYELCHIDSKNRILLDKYCNSSLEGVVDNKSEMERIDDCVIKWWGQKWRMPTMREQDELVNGCHWKWVSDYKGSGMSGSLGTSKFNKKQIFLPASGFRSDYDCKKGFYWSSTLMDSRFAHGTYVDEKGPYVTRDMRFYGQCVRAVLDSTASR